MKVSLTMALLWSATLFYVQAATPQVADIKPYKEGFVIAYSDGKLCFADIEGVVQDSVQLKTEVAGIDIREDYVLAVTPDCAVMKVQQNGRSSRLCRSQIRNGADRVVGIACSSDRTLILTVSGKILGTSDFESFSTLDFNSTYSSYYDYTRFCAICASDNYFYIAGVFSNGMPAVFTSAAGNIWSERTLSYTEGSRSSSLWDWHMTAVWTGLYWGVPMVTFSICRAAHIAIPLSASQRMTSRRWLSIQDTVFSNSI